MIDRLTARTQYVFDLLTRFWRPGKDEYQFWLHAFVALYSVLDQ